MRIREAGACDLSFMEQVLPAACNWSEERFTQGGSDTMLLRLHG